MIACASSSSCASSFSLLGGGGAAFAAWRSRQTQGSGQAPSPSQASAQSVVTPSRPSAPKRMPRRRPRRVAKKAGRAIKKIFRKPLKRVSRLFKRRRRRKPTRRIIRRRKPTRRIIPRRKPRRIRRRRKPRRVRRRRSPRRRSRRSSRRRRCFAPETLVNLLNGRIVPMKDLKLGDILINGSVVKATMQIRNESDPYYKLPGDIYVTGSHYIEHCDSFVHVSKLKHAKLTGRIDAVVYCLITSDHKIPVGEFMFWDWEDNYLVT